jgi:DnaJ-class molecular chaperone
VPVVSSLRDRPILAVPKKDQTHKEKSRSDKSAPIRRTNTPSRVPCPDCGSGLQDVETCTTCDGTGRVSPERLAAPEDGA